MSDENPDVNGISEMGEGINENTNDNSLTDELSSVDYGINVNTGDIVIDKDDEDFDINVPVFRLTLPSYVTNAYIDCIWFYNDVETGHNHGFEYDESYNINESNDWCIPITLSPIFNQTNDESNFSFISNINDGTSITVNVCDSNSDSILYSVKVLFKYYNTFINLIVKNNSINGEVRNNKNIFQARVFMEQDSNVYGAEVILFGSRTEEPIEKILITDVTDFDRLTAIVENLQETYIPYTSKDKQILDTTVDYLSNKEDGEKEAAYLAVKDKWSYLKNKGNLENILDNNLNITSDLRESYISNEQCIINATHLNGYTAGDFSKNTHTHNEYLNNIHSNIYANGTQYGHVKVIDNLNTTDVTGSALSAKQGYNLNKKISDLSNTIKNTWNKTVINKYLTLRVNPLFRLVVAEYNRTDYTGLKKETGVHQLHSKGTLDNYAPTTRVLTPIYRGDIVLMFNTDGGITIHNLSKHDSWNIHAQVIWYY